MPDAITMDQIKKFVAAWFLALDQHAPLEQVLTFLAEKDLYVQYPDGDIRDFDGFNRWYKKVTCAFFDENHNVKSVEGTISGDRAQLRVVVGWQASWFEPPAAKSKRTSMDATQTWTVRRTARNIYGLEIVTCDDVTVPFAYAPGFACL